MFDIVNFTEDIPTVVAPDFITLSEVGRAVSAGEAMGVEQRFSDLTRLVGLGEHEMAGRTPWPKHAIEVLSAVELSELGET